MTTVDKPPPTPDEIMRRTAQWVARLYGVRVTFTVDDGRGNVGTTDIDRRVMSSKGQLIGWPLGICRDMDTHATRHGLAHWSATSADSNEWWVRRDGLPHRCKWDKPGGYPAELHALDIDEPPRPWVFGARPDGFVILCGREE